MSSSSRIDTISLVVGPDHHGVVRHAVTVAVAADVGMMRRRSVALGDLVTLPDRVRVCHLHYTDRLFGTDATSAAANLVHLIGVVGGLERCVVVSMHDIPVVDGTSHSSLRVHAYRQVAARADVVVVASAHERERLRAIGVGAEIRVIPLPIGEAADAPVAAGGLGFFPVAAGRTVAVLGFIYPGKGHDDVIEASAALPADVTVLALGRPSEGHADLAGDLEQLADRRGRRLVVTGSLDDVQLVAALRQVDVPVVPARTMSSSASLATWIGAGRRPLVAANDYTREISRAAPGLMTRYDPAASGRLADAICTALADPDTTWHAGDIPSGYSPTAVGRGHRRLYAELAGRS